MATKKDFLPFEKAREFVHSLEFKNQKEWMEWRKSDKRPPNIPTNPNRTYKKEWEGFSDWLGTENLSGSQQSKKMLPFDEALKFVRKLKLKNGNEWRDYLTSGKKPDFISSHPDRTYRKEWKDLGHWLGTFRVSDQERRKNFPSFEKAREFVHSLGIKSQRKWNEFCKSKKLPKDIPNSPERTYKNKGWQGWGDWFGTGKISTHEISKNWLPWYEAKALYRKIGKENNLKNLTDWNRYIKTNKLPKGLPPYPANIYTKERVWRKMQE